MHKNTMLVHSGYWYIRALEIVGDCRGGCHKCNKYPSESNGSNCRIQINLYSLLLPS